MLLKKMQQGLDTMARTGCTHALVVPGRYDESLAWDYQTPTWSRTCAPAWMCASPRGWWSSSSRSIPRTTPGCS